MVIEPRLTNADVAASIGIVTTVPFDSGAWRFEAEEHRQEEHLGRPSLFLRGGFAFVDGVELTDGVLAFDVAFGPERGFHGGIWRVLDERSFEWFFLRPHQSGNPDATQYTPVFNGNSGWQLYHGERYTVPVSYRFGEWNRVRVAFAGDRADVWVGESEEPALRVFGLKRDVGAGGLGVTSSVAPAHFSRFSFAELDELPPAEAPELEPVPEGVIASWEVSDTFAESELGVELDLAGRRWTRLDPEPGGLADLARVNGVDRELDTVFARATIESDGAQLARLEFGFSDRARVYLNGRALYAGDDGYRTRDYRFLGSIGWWDAVYLPLEAGKNELVVAVSESFGGWGLQARLAD